MSATGRHFCSGGPARTKVELGEEWKAVALGLRDEIADPPLVLAGADGNDHLVRLDGPPDLLFAHGPREVRILAVVGENGEETLRLAHAVLHRLFRERLRTHASAHDRRNGNGDFQYTPACHRPTS